MNKVIWMCWFQGEDDSGMPPLNRECIKRWRELNGDYDVRILCDKTISNYVPEYFEILKNSPSREHPACSDLLRILLLSKYGGVWVDASVYPMQPLSDFWNSIINETGFFTYRFMPRGGYDNRKMCETVSWFLCVDRARHPLIDLWKEAFVYNFQNIETWEYFTFHESLSELYDSNPEVKFTIDNMIQINEKIPHSAMLSWKNRKDSFMYKRPNFKQ